MAMSDPIDFLQRLKEKQSTAAQRALTDIGMPEWLRLIAIGMGEEYSKQLELKAHHGPLAPFDISTMELGEWVMFAFGAEGLIGFSIQIRDTGWDDDLWPAVRADVDAEKLTSKILGALKTYVDAMTEDRETVPMLPIMVGHVIGYLSIYFSQEATKVERTHENFLRYQFGEDIVIYVHPDMFVNKPWEIP